MSYIFGEFPCKLDAKGRMLVPANLKKQLPEAEREGLFVKRGFEKHLVIYSRKEWLAILNELNKLNQFEKKNRDFIKFFINGVSEITVDAVGRILFPKTLLEYAGIGTDVVLVGNLTKIDVWAQSVYDEQMNNEPENFAQLAEEVMGNKANRNNE